MKPVKLTQENIAYIKDQTRLGTLTYKALAEKFGVSIGTIGKLAWKKQDRAIKTHTNNVRLRSMDSEALGQYVAKQTLGILHRTEELRPLYIELWKRFGKLNKDETICGCRNRTEYCEKILHRTIRSVQHVLRGPRKPSLAHKADFNEPLHRFERAEINDFVPEDIQEEDDEKKDAEREAEQKRKQTEQEAWDKAHPEEAAERKTKTETREREAEEFHQRFSLHSSIKKPPSQDIQEFASLGRRAAAAKHHPDKGGNTERMAQLNHVADWLEQLATEARSEAA